MNLINAMKNHNVIKNTKGGLYYRSSLNANLDFFSGVSRHNSVNDIQNAFAKAFIEDDMTAIANLLYVLDIRGGKGERRIFKECFSLLANADKKMALKVLYLIPILGRYDYILEGLNTLIDEEVVALIKEQLDKDMNSDNPSLLAKWLPSLRTHNKNNHLAKHLVNKLNMSEKEYRKVLSTLRSKINIVEKNITNKTFDNIDFNAVPCKAMLKYQDFFKNNITEEYNEYLNSLTKGEAKVNTSGLFCYEIINKVWKNNYKKDVLIDTMWTQQKDVLNGINKNILVVADTSGSMTWNNSLPLANSIGLALYTAERNTGIFKDCFITFSSNPTIQKVTGENISQKVRNIKSINSNTDIDKVFKLILKEFMNENVDKQDFPSHILIVSDMEFDDGVYSKGGTNFEGWKKAFEAKGFKLPTIIFWNVACYTKGLPVTKKDNDVVMVSGFSTNVLENIFNLDNYNPINCMLTTLNKYLKLIKD